MNLTEAYSSSIRDREMACGKWYRRAMESMADANRLAIWLTLSAAVNLALLFVIIALIGAK